MIRYYGKTCKLPNILMVLSIEIKIHINIYNEKKKCKPKFVKIYIPAPLQSTLNICILANLYLSSFPEVTNLRQFKPYFYNLVKYYKHKFISTH